MGLLALGQQVGADDSATDKIVVKVGGYPFEPFVEQGGGITRVFLEELNTIQDMYHFEFVPIPARRRYELLRRGVIDAVFFEMPLWGWEPFEEEIDVTHPLLRGAEVFIANSSGASKENLFQLSPDRKVALTLGYHYAFADYNVDQSFIHSKVDAVFSESVSETLRYLRSGAVEIALVSDLFLRHEFMKHPDLQYQLVQRPLPDQEYELSAVLRVGGPINARKLDRLFSRMDIHAFFRAYGLEGLVMAH